MNDFRFSNSVRMIRKINVKLARKNGFQNISEFEKVCFFDSYAYGFESTNLATGFKRDCACLNCRDESDEEYSGPWTRITRPSLQRTRFSTKIYHCRVRKSKNRSRLSLSNLYKGAYLSQGYFITQHDTPRERERFNTFDVHHVRKYINAKSIPHAIFNRETGRDNFHNIPMFRRWSSNKRFSSLNPYAFCSTVLTPEVFYAIQDNLCIRTMYSPINLLRNFLSCPIMRKRAKLILRRQSVRDIRMLWYHSYLNILT